MNIKMNFINEETLCQLDIQIKQRAEMLGLSVGEYLKRLAIADIRSIDNLEVEEKYKLKRS